MGATCSVTVFPVRKVVIYLFVRRSTLIDFMDRIRFVGPLGMFRRFPVMQFASVTDFAFVVRVFAFRRVFTKVAR